MTPLFWVLLSVGALCASALMSAIVSRRDRAALWIGSIGSIAGCVGGIVASLVALARGQEESIKASWSIPIGGFHVGIDWLSSFFLICIFVVSGLAAVYGVGYLQGYLGKRRLAPAVAFFNLLVAAMVVIVIARDGVLFLMAWEVMSVTSFFLVTFDDEREDVRRAGMTYLMASQLGVVFLFVLFALFARHAGSFDLNAFAISHAPSARLANICFVLAVVGFGTKAGFWPFHIWLPDAHPAAPSHVSALMSGVMIKMGIYGLLRVLMLLGPPPGWWGVLMLAVGGISGMAGVLHALAQHDLKRLLAYHSVENIGIIALGIGIGLLGQSYDQPTMAILGYSGALLHVLNHGLFKGLLFQAAGSILHGAGTRNIESLGGLYRRMPITGSAFLVGSVAISGLPPLNGFVSEWMIYVGAFRGAGNLPVAGTALAVTTVAVIALIGGLAAACFVKAFGIIFLGEARSREASEAHEASASMQLSMVIGATLCFAIGVFPAWAFRLVGPVASSLSRTALSTAPILGQFDAITRVMIVLLLLIGMLALLRGVLLKARDVRFGETWSCGYTGVTTRMQYTASSFAEPVLAPFSTLLHRQVHLEGPTGYFPEYARYEEHFSDIAGERFIVPLTHRFVAFLEKLRVIQHGRLQLYLAYIFFTLIALLALQFSGLLSR
ncbi:MAG: proton-conducting transporter membrane subunit [Candidatus Binatus sp.]|uniref:proton-conducting transporter transmembrane domain-containing protein n=1 Tax=Candidatus Binatus sp. TaxID=2811406 RepID=UPI00271B017C|nr:proton-conducting transporter membrane subunit [Candidatus Binatus sp.]MDO8432314.1 proton-conducting transporter membrane subunit [Candidatus Binatus sp.]